MGLIRGSSKDVVVYVGEEERRSFRARACETRARVYICAAPFTSITLTSIIQRKSAAPRGPRFARAVHEMHPSWPAFEITEAKKKKKSRETKLSAQKKKDDDLCPPLSLIFIYLNTFRFSVRGTAIRAQFANRQKRLYLRLYLYVESIFCNYAIGSRNFSSGIILTRVFRRWNDSGEINLRR